MRERSLSSQEKIQSTLIESVKDVSFSSFDGRTLLQDASFNIHSNNVLVVTGKSGVGKSLLLSIIADKEIPETGQVTFSKLTTVISFVPQRPEEMDFGLNDSIKEVFWKSRGLDILEFGMKKAEEEMEKGNCSDSLIRQYGEYQERYSVLNGWNATQEMEEIMNGIGLVDSFSQHITPETKLNEVSSGQRTKILIGQALFSNCDLLILDDPTSHLDKESVDWLINYINNTSKSVVIASQERDFINRCADQIVEITDRGRVINFNGNLDDYEVKRDAILSAEEAKIKSIQQEYDNLSNTYFKFKNEGVFKRSDKMAARGRAMESRLKRLQNEINGIPKKEKELKVREKKFETSQNFSDGAILVIDSLIVKYGDFEAVNLQGQKIELKRGKKLLIEGDNGSGKSTLMNSLVDNDGFNFNLKSGRSSIGNNLKIGHFSPDMLVGKGDTKIFNIVLDSMEYRNESEATAILNYFGFSYQGLRDRSIETLSSSERSQLLLSVLMAKKPDILLLDEPSDKLSQSIKERLATAVNGYNGSLVLISHDSEFKKMLNIDYRIKLDHGHLVEFESID